MSQIAIAEQQRAPRQVIEVLDAVPVLDTARFEHMQRIATVMAKSSLLPDSLTMIGKKDDKEPLPYEQVMANAFMVVNQAVRWGLDPFSVAQCVSVVHGRLCYEGKLVAAVLDAKGGIRLNHYFIGDGEALRIYLCDRQFDEQITVEGVEGPLSSFLKPGFRVPGFRLFDGSVAEWKTTGAGSPWSPKNSVRMLIYRGTRDWTRIYEPALMLGVYTDDEMLDLAENARAARARPVGGMADRLALARSSAPASGGFSTADLSEIKTETTEEPTSPGADHATAAAIEHPATAKTSEKASPEAGDAGAVQDRSSASTAPTHSEQESLANGPCEAVSERTAPESREGSETHRPEATPAMGETAAKEPNLGGPEDTLDDGSSGRTEELSHAQPAGSSVSLSEDDRENLRFYVDELESELDEAGVNAVKIRFWRGKGIDWTGPLGLAIGAITVAHKDRAASPQRASVEECADRCRAAMQ